jgi:hypothetical protein
MGQPGPADCALQRNRGARQAGSRAGRWPRQAGKQAAVLPSHPATHQQLRLVRLLQLKLGGGPLGGLGGHGGALQA